MIEVTRELEYVYSEEGTTTEDEGAALLFNPQFEVRRNRVDWAFQSAEMRRVAHLRQEGNEHYWMPETYSVRTNKV